MDREHWGVCVYLADKRIVQQLHEGTASLVITKERKKIRDGAKADTTEEEEEEVT